ncbi:MAG: hypothetical protein H0U57_03825 [Tatlockia sp.]|nr:hypothetical protein [Tatlockia sp.]
MNFLAWCFLKHGISDFSDGKIVNRVFIPFNTEDICYLDPLILACRGFITSSNGEKGLTFTQNAYLILERNLRIKFDLLSGYNNFEMFKESYFNKLGLDFYGKKQYRMPPSIQIKIEDELAKKNFIQQFAKYSPKAVFDPLTKSETIQMPGRFLKHLYGVYFRSAEFKPVNNLTHLQERKLQLTQLLHLIEKGKMNKNLNYARKLALDYDNNDFSINGACTTYAISLKIYAELYKEALSEDDYHLLFAASHLLAASDRNGQLKQSLLSDASFITYIKNLYSEGLEAKHLHLKHYPLVSELNKEKSEQLLKAIDDNTEHLLYGNCKTRANKNTYFKAQRFLPDFNNDSDTDEIIFQAGGMLGHSALFRLIKVPMLKNGEKAAPKEDPAYFDYFKVENNLGAGCTNSDTSNTLCFGTHITKIQPYIRDSRQFLMPFLNDPKTNPQEYQAAMEGTLKELIKVERLVLFYREPSEKNDNQRYSPLNSAEGKEWNRLHKLQQLLKGKPYDMSLSYSVIDVLNLANTYQCAVENKQGYMQEGGSCLIFSIKSLVDSVLRQHLSTLPSHFMQQHDAWDCIKALQGAIDRNNKNIEFYSPLFIDGSSNELIIWVKAFRAFLQEGKEKIIGLELSHSKNSDYSTIILRNNFLKKQWSTFISNWQAEKENRKEVLNPNGFFKINPGLRPSSTNQFSNHMTL